MLKSLIKRSIQCFILTLVCATTLHAKNYIWGDGGEKFIVGPLIIGANDTLFINSGEITLQGKIVIQTKNVIHVNGDAVIKTERAPRLGSLHFDTKFNNISLHLNANLQFQGASDGSSLLVTTVNSNVTTFFIAGGRKLSFTRGSGSKSGGARCLVLMNQNGTPTFNFARLADGNDDATVYVGPRSSLGFTSHDELSNERSIGAMKFEPSNSGKGRLVLDIDNHASVLISPVKSSVATLPDLDDIDFSLPAGGSATFEVAQSSGANAVGNNPAGLLITNRNESFFDLLYDPFFELGARADKEDYKGSFSGIRWGFVLGNNGTLLVGNNAYVDYVGLTNNKCPECKCDAVKLRNASALIVDGSNDPNAAIATISLGDCSGLYFRSGVDACGKISADFTVAPDRHTQGIGEIVFDVEAPVVVNGSNLVTDCKKSKLEILSLQVVPTGATLFIAPNNCLPIFPARTFETNSKGILLSYNTACWLINDSLDIFNATIAHTDTNHLIVEKNDILSEPAYIGGDSWKFKKSAGIKPSIGFHDASFFVHESVAFTGLDLKVPNIVSTGGNCVSNTSKFVFFQNGKRCDNGTGRSMILGTEIGSESCGKNCVVISRDAHLDIVPDSATECTGNNAFDTLVLLTAANDNTIIPPQQCILDATEVAEQSSIQTIFLGQESNISIGVNADCDLFNTPQSSLLINGNFFSFETRSGCLRNPCKSSETGVGGIFVDCNGSIIAGGVEPDICFGSISDLFLCRVLVNMGVMVTKSHNGTINLPKNRVFFDPGIGISEWHLDLSDPLQQVIIDTNECLSEYTLNWIATKKDFNTFCPYQVTCYDPCGCPPVQDKNVSALPIIKGRVDQLQIKGSRLGDQAHISVDGGVVRELLFIPGDKSAQAPVGVVVLDNSGSIGLGSTHKNVESINASVTLGVNGVTLIANGSGQVTLNEDIIINNICSLLKGPDFNKNRSGDTLTITSECCRTLRVKSDGILDLSSFGAGDTILIAGDVKLILEPGARVNLNGANLRLQDRASIVVEPLVKQDFFDEYINPNAGTLRSTDGVRVKLSGVGSITLAGCSSFFVDKNAYFGIETWPNCDVTQTNITLNIIDSAQMLLGSGCLPEGGTMQIGNTESDPLGSVSFTLNLIGPNALFSVEQQAFLGWGVGIVDKSSSIPNEWLVQTTYNVNSIAINVLDGVFRHNLIFSGDDSQASLLAIGGTVQNFTFDSFNIVSPVIANVSPSSVLGGGNFVRINPVGPINPTVLEDVVTSGDVLAGIFTSKPLLAVETVTGTIDQIWNALRVQNITMQSFPGRATAGPSYIQNFIRTGYVDQGKIGRSSLASIIGAGGTTTKQAQTLKIGALFLILSGGTPPRPILLAFELP
jgi:hypothetical protein